LYVLCKEIPRTKDWEISTANAVDMERGRYMDKEIEKKEEIEETEAETADNEVKEAAGKEEIDVGEKKEKKVWNIALFFQRPVEAIQKVVKNNCWKSGIVFILIYLLIAGLVSSFQFVQVKLASYDAAIDYAKERLEQAEDNYRTYATSYYKAQVEIYKENLSSARTGKWKNFADFDFYSDIAENFSTVVSASAIRFVLLIVILFVVGKVLNGQGKFSQIVAGVGLSVNVYYISLIILPLLANIPYLSSFSALTGIVGSLFFLLVYFVFQSTFEFEESKSVIWTFVSMLITVFLTNLIVYSDVLTSSTVNNLLK